ncbi:1115_t:CDS:1, partial [Racocetra fulgida]
KPDKHYAIKKRTRNPKDEYRYNQILIIHKAKLDEQYYKLDKEQ